MPPTSQARIVLMIGLVTAVMPAALAQERRGPLPLAVAASLVSHNNRSSFDLSPDGTWVAHTANSAETLVRATDVFSTTGKPFAEGDSRMQALLTSTISERVVRLGGTVGSSWAPVWSPDGRAVAYYADDDGGPGLWIWERATGESRRFPGVTVRPFFGFELPRWSPDGQCLLCKILPATMSVAEANALAPAAEQARRYPSHAADEAGVLVLGARAKQSENVKPDEPKPRSSAFANRSMADLAILDLTTQRVTRIAEHIKPSWYAFSPDQRQVAYTDLRGHEPDAQQAIYDIRVFELATSSGRTLAANVRMSYGIELNWSPDSQALAYIGCGQLAKGDVVVLSVRDGAAKSLASADLPSFDLGGESPPLWDESGESVWAIGKDGKLWRVVVSSGRGRAVGDLAGHEIRAVVTRPELPTLWTTDGAAAWVLTRARESQKSGIFRIDSKTGESRAVLEEDKSYATTFNVDASDTGRIAFFAKDQQHPGDAFVLDTRTNCSRQVSHLNPDLEGYELGRARVIEWQALDGPRRRGALLLPPVYQAGQHLPMVVWVYGGTNGSTYVNTFGFWGNSPNFNMHVLATRGFAVLFPDAPLRRGTPMADLLQTVMPGVDAAIEQGYADPARLAVMGQSYGSYCSLALIAQTPRFRAAVITAAVLHPDLFAAYLEMSPDGSAGSTGYYEHGQGNMGGTPWEYHDRYVDNSPLFRFDQIETPLLIGQGDKDGRLIAADAIFMALRRLGKEVEYRVYENEGHVITRRANVLDFWRRRLEFLDEHLDIARDDEGQVLFDGDRVKSRR
ncbi:MAG: prolyl oligopeptidase family serine peptidase [Planctomycetota bacterium]